jgi:NADP-dependent 3-hydroxy acid dehydrogenase YdfG
LIASADSHRQMVVPETDATMPWATAAQGRSSRSGCRVVGACGLREEEEMGRLDGKVAIVTGAGGGIGRAVARKLAGEGAMVVAAEIDEERLARRRGRHERDHPHAALRRLEGRRGRTARCRHGRRVRKLTTICNNAGISIPAKVTDLSEDAWDRTIDVNLKGGVYLGCK